LTAGALAARLVGVNTEIQEETPALDAGPFKAPFPYFGGKSRVASEVWKRFGKVRSYVEPFFGSGAVLLRRPAPFSGLETVNDLDGLLVNAWRAIQAAPDEVWRHADCPVSEVDMRAREGYLLDARDDLVSRLKADPRWFDAEAAGLWIWGASTAIGSDWMRGKSSRPHIGGAQGVHRRSGSMPMLDPSSGRGVHRRSGSMPMLSPEGGQGVHRAASDGREMLRALSARLRPVRILCGDWKRCVRSDTALGVRQRDPRRMAGVFLDPPYAKERRDDRLYSVDTDPAVEVLEWAQKASDDARLRIAVCGYAGEHDALEEAGWAVYRWQAHGGMGNQGVVKSGRVNSNKGLETIWFSPSCLDGEGEEIAQEPPGVWAFEAGAPAESLQGDLFGGFQQTLVL